MANKKKLEEQRLMIENLKRKRRNIFYTAIAIIVAIVVIVGVLVGSGVLQSGSSNDPTSVTSGTWTKVSSSDIGQGGVNIYFLSWQGCPIGASDSFAIYHYFHTNFPSLSNSTMIKAEHFSDPSESPSDIPGLLFHNFTATSSGITYSFHVVYVYGETLPPDGPTSVNAGISTLKAVSGFPSAVINMFIKMETSVTTVGLGNQAIASYAGHLTSSLIVTGPKASYYFEGEMYNPSDISGVSPSTILSSISSYSYILTASSNIQTTVSTVL